MNQFYYKNNRLQQLKGFYYTVQTGSISQCAKKIGLTQAAVSMQIKSLERDLNVELFVRHNKKLQLTKEGKTFYSHAIPYVQGLEDLFESSSFFFKSQNQNFIRIAANHVSICYILPNYIKEFKSENPKVKFKICNLSKEDGINRLIKNEIDFFIYPIGQDNLPEELEFTNIVNYRPMALVAHNHDLAHKKEIDFKDLKPYELIRIDPKFITLPAFEKLIKDNALHSNIEFEMSDWEILKKFVKANIGVAIISDIILEGSNNNDVVGLRLKDYSNNKMSYGVLTKKGKIFNEIQKKFITLITKQKLLQGQKNANVN